MKILLTGATGFVGSHTAEVLLEHGHNVRANIRASSSLAYLKGLDIELIEANLLSQNDCQKLVQGMDVVIHNAGVTRAKNTAAFRRYNHDMTLLLAQAAQQAGVSHFVFVSSLAARGADGVGKPSSAYGWSKLEAEKALATLDIATISLRLAGVYGPRDKDILSLFQLAQRGILPLPDKGLFQPIYVRDAAEVLLAACHSHATGAYNIAEPTRYPWTQMLSIFEEILNKKIHPLYLPATLFETIGFLSEQTSKLLRTAPQFDLRRAQDLARFQWTIDDSTLLALETALQWRAKTDLTKGMATTATWYKKAHWL